MSAEIKLAEETPHNIALERQQQIRGRKEKKVRVVDGAVEAYEPAAPALVPGPRLSAVFNGTAAVKEEDPHFATLRNQWKLRQMLRYRIRIVEGRVEVYQLPDPAQDIEKTILNIAAANDLIGHHIEGKGLLLGTWRPMDSEGNDLKKVFNVYAAPQELMNKDGKRGQYQYEDAVASVSRLSNWHGYNGTSYRNDSEFYQSILDGTYAGGWIIPPRELLTGAAADAPVGTREGEPLQPDNFLTHSEKGKLRETVELAKNDRFGRLGGFWSSTENRDDLSQAWVLRFKNNAEEPCNKKTLFACRPIRLELRQ